MTLRIQSNAGSPIGIVSASTRLQFIPVDLCQRADGNRYYEFTTLENSAPNPECVLKTEPMRGIELLAWLQSGRNQHLTLTTGEQFLFDAHGIWLLYSEVQRMRDRKTMVDGRSIVLGQRANAAIPRGVKWQNNQLHRSRRRCVFTWLITSGGSVNCVVIRLRSEE